MRWGCRRSIKLGVLATSALDCVPGPPPSPMTPAASDLPAASRRAGSHRAARQDRGVARLAALLEEARARAHATRRPVLVSLVEPAPAVDPLAALEALAGAGAVDGAPAGEAGGTRMYWARPDEGFAIAGFGTVASLTAAGPHRVAELDRAWAELRAGALVDDPSGGTAGVGPVLMGGLAFRPEGSGTARWSGFPGARLTVPRLQVTTAHGRCWVTTTLLVGADGRPDVEPEVLAALRARALAQPAPAVRAFAGTPACALHFESVRPEAEWRALVVQALTAIRGGAMEKVVLARAVHARTECAFDVGLVLRHLRVAHPECHVFGCWHGDRAFVGASPERLVRLEGHEVRASSLAGSIRRGTTPDEDAALARELLASPKERAEHEMVRTALCGALATLCDDVTAAPAPSILRLAQVQHLHTPVRARVRPGRSLLELVGALHPTPAVGGAPTGAALRFLREHEQLDRGWYAAPVGWVGAGRGEFAVALRSALVTRHEAWLFAGCGIVADSRPEAEYAESLLKLRPMQLALGAALTGGPPAAARRCTGARDHAR